MFFIGSESSSSDLKFLRWNGNRFSPSHTVDDKAFSTSVFQFCLLMRLYKCEDDKANLMQSSEPLERLVGLSDDVGAGFISGHSSQPASASELNVDRSVDLPAQDEMGNMGVSKVIRVDQKRFFFDLGSNNMGHFLRISEVKNGGYLCLFI
ncbi:hypothetical protein Patl1_31995 [Pistacia atlantica]|uniref:Uncharacterized protein n=1 Tax=Pistacia atlantica TaxID=434234 RepID=A0ACC1ARC8_9ROSI|nr:hypothetical protein Patl1_31995 [Pistacia atlantica]